MRGPCNECNETKKNPALRMRASCVQCHNSHPDSPGTDWRVGDVRGVLEIIRPLDKDATRMRDDLRGPFLVAAGLCGRLLVLSNLILLAGRCRPA
jgi:adenylate cyclase